MLFFSWAAVNSCVVSSLLYASETWTLLKADIAKLEAFHMTNQRLILGHLLVWVCYERRSRHPLTAAVHKSKSKETLSLWPHQAYGWGCSCTPSPTSLWRHDRTQDNLAPGGENQVVRENAGWSRSPRAQGSFLMLGVLRRIGQHGGRYDPLTVKRREVLVL